MPPQLLIQLFSSLNAYVYWSRHCCYWLPEITTKTPAVSDSLLSGVNTAATYLIYYDCY